MRPALYLGVHRCLQGVDSACGLCPAQGLTSPLSLATSVTSADAPNYHFSSTVFQPDSWDLGGHLWPFYLP